MSLPDQSDALSIDLYDNETGKATFYGFHMNGTQHAAFANANAALAWQRGLDRPEFFYMTDENGQRCTLHDQARRPGHAYAILDSLAKADRAARDQQHARTED